nr:MAG TPA: hypothetical protein [Caudoviricetes sp.]
MSFWFITARRSPKPIESINESSLKSLFILKFSRLMRTYFLNFFIKFNCSGVKFPEPTGV